MHGDTLSYAKTFDQALRGLLEISKKKPMTLTEIKEKEVSLKSLINQAQQAFENYLKYQGEKKFGRAADSLEDLQKKLEDLSERSGYLE
jgi:hypothetical protein